MQTVYKDLAKQYSFTKPYQLVAGGAERQDSVWNGLEALPRETEIVAIQDGARPCTNQALITATIAAARTTGAAVAAQPVTDTIKESDDGKTVSRTLERGKLWAVQTPQVFRVEVIRKALAMVKEKRLRVTDDTATCELIGQPVRLVAGAAPNPKVTVAADVAYIELLLKQMGGLTS
jgi:2-C-methyl-D-erythritol 4-phosphate cytidylyltransferase